jgi:hypothetical protein
VADTGAGIAPAFLPHVFERFRQPTAPQREAPAAWGWGCSLPDIRRSQEVVSASLVKAPGAAPFTVTLPVAATAWPRPLQRRLSLSIPPVEPMPVEGLRVLLVDDEPDRR